MSARSSEPLVLQAVRGCCVCATGSVEHDGVVGSQGVDGVAGGELLEVSSANSSSSSKSSGTEGIRQSEVVSSCLSLSLLTATEANAAGIVCWTDLTDLLLDDFFG